MSKFSKIKKQSNKVLVLDLDNTLVYAMTTTSFKEKKVDPSCEVKTTSYTDPKSGYVIELKIIIRPYAMEMIKQLSPYYEIVIFTAASKVYADAVLNVLDPEGTLIDYRLYRGNCILNNDTYVKDLRIIDRDLSSIVMIDDNISSFCNQLENGIFVTPFFGTNPDSELGSLWIFLRQIVMATDARVPITAKYNLTFFYKMYNLNKKQKENSE